jgi:hypothetical protein
MGKFWKLNNVKVLWVSLMVFVLLLGLVIFLNKIDGSNFTMGSLTVPVIITPLVVIGYIIKGINYYKIIARILRDTSEKSIMPLFDSGVSIELTDEKSMITYTKENFKGTISGLPVDVSFYQADRTSWAHLYFSFGPLVKTKSGKRIHRDVSFSINLRNRLKKDIKPEVLKLVHDLKELGYVPAPQ